MTSVDRLGGVERPIQNPWEAARFFPERSAQNPVEAKYLVKVIGKENAGELKGATFFGYFDAKKDEPTRLHLPILTKADLHRLATQWGSENELCQSLSEHPEGALAYLNAKNNIPLKKAVMELRSLLANTKVGFSSEHRDPDSLVLKHDASLVIATPQRIIRRFVSNVTPYAMTRLAYGLSERVPFIVNPLSLSEFYSEVKRVFSKS